MGSSPPCRSSRLAALFCGSFRNEDLQRQEPTNINSTDAVPYARNEILKANNRENRICGEYYE